MSSVERKYPAAKEALHSLIRKTGFNCQANLCDYRKCYSEFKPVQIKQAVKGVAIGLSDAE
jgi:hypothetical protein